MEIRERIIQKSHELFLRYGIKSITMDDIAKPMGISKKTIYQFFEDKNELVHSVVKQILEIQKNSLDAIQKNAHDPIAEVLKLSEFVKETMENMGMSVMFELQKYHPKSFNIFEDFKENCVSDLITKNLKKGKEMGLYRSDIDVNIMAKLRLQEI
ncbi:MAG TPA: TetR/AcrR family transcriptional regulator, partial [Cytophagaceae bacterium]